MAQRAFDISFEHFKQREKELPFSASVVGIQLSRASKAFKNKVEIRMMNINQWGSEMLNGLLTERLAIFRIQNEFYEKKKEMRRELNWVGVSWACVVECFES